MFLTKKSQKDNIYPKCVSLVVYKWYQEKIVFLESMRTCKYSHTFL